jgi:hypothetical protein
MTKRALLLAFLAFPAVGLVAAPGCVADADGEYEAFAKRASKGGGPIECGSDGGCTPPAAGEIDGDYLFALSAVIGPQKPLLFLTTVTTTAGAAGLEVTWKLQPLSAADRTTPVGTPVEFEPFTVASNGCFLADPGPLDVTGEANGITGNPITADVTLTGQLCGTDGFYCGQVGGVVTSPINLPLDGSTFTLTKLPSPGAYPDPPAINCDKDLAEPKGS